MRVWMRGAIAVAMAVAGFIAADSVLHATGAGGFTPSARELTERAAEWNQPPLVALGLSYWAQSKTSDPDLLFAARQARIHAWRQLGRPGPAADLLLEDVRQNPTDYAVMEASFALMDANNLHGLRELTALVTGGDAPGLQQPDLVVSGYVAVLQRQGRASEAMVVLDGLDVSNWSDSAKRRFDELKPYFYLQARQPDAALEWLRQPAPAYCLQVHQCTVSRQIAEAQARAMRGECERADAILSELVERLRAEPFREEIDPILNSQGHLSSYTVSASPDWECRALGMLGRREEAVDACLQASETNPSTATAASRAYAEYGVPTRLECVPGGTAG